MRPHSSTEAAATACDGLPEVAVQNVLSTSRNPSNPAGWGSTAARIPGARKSDATSRWTNQRDSIVSPSSVRRLFFFEADFVVVTPSTTAGVREHLPCEPLLDLSKR